MPHGADGVLGIHCNFDQLVNVRTFCVLLDGLDNV